MILAKNKKSLDDILNKYPTNKPYAFDGKPISTKSETKREQNKSSAPSLDDILNKYPTKPKYTFDGKSPAATGGTKKKYTDFNSETQNAYKSAKDKVTSKTTIKSNLSDTERKKRIGEIETEIRNLNTQLHGIGRAGAYGSTESLKPLKEKTEKRIAELSKELKSLERVGTFSASELKQFEIDDAKAKVSSARQKVNSYGARPTLESAESYKQAVSEQYKAQEDLKTLERQQTLYDKIDKHSDVVHKEGVDVIGERAKNPDAYSQGVRDFFTDMSDFEAQWRANYRKSDLEREADKAMSEYLKNPTEANREIAYAYDAFAKAYAKNNKEALDDENVKASWLTKSAAGYLPQFEDQIVPELIGGTVGGLLGGLAGMPTVGAALGAGMGTFSQMHDVTRGSVYRALLAEGVDEEIALEAANDEALVSALLESGGTALGWMFAGGGKAIGAITNAAKASVAKGSTNMATKFLAKFAVGTATDQAAKAVARPLWNKGIRAVGGIVGNGISEYLEEFTQGAASEANREKALATVNKEIGQFGRGNIDLYNRPIYKNEDGTISTVDSVTFEVDGKFIVLPTIVRDGKSGARRLESDEEIWNHYVKTGEYLGEFDTLEEANGYAQKVHSAQAYYYDDKTVAPEDNLWSGGAKIVGKALSGEDPNTLSELHAQGMEGFKIGLMFGGTQTAVNNIVSHYSNAKTVKLQNEVADTILNDEESLDALIEEGKASGEGTVSEKIATEIETARENGKKVTRDQVKRLIESNEVYIKAEEQTAETDTLEQAAMDVVNERNRVDGESRKRGRVTAQMLETLSRNNEVITNEEAKKVTGFGDNGANLVVKRANAEGATFYETVAEIKPSYEAGFENPDLDIKKMAHTFKSPVHQEAYLAGQKDGMMQALADKAHKVVVNKDSGFKVENFKANPLPSDVTQSQVETVDLMAKALGLRGRMTEGLKGNAELNKLTGEVPIDTTFQREVGSEGNKRKVSIVFHAAHEMAVHRVVEAAPEEGRAFVYAMYRYLAGDESSINSTLNTLADKKRAAYAKQDVEISLAKAKEEVSASNILLLYDNNEAKFHKAIERIVNGTDTKAKQGLRKYIEILNDILRKVGEFLSGKSAEERAKIQTELDEVRRLRDMFETAFAKAVENVNAIKTDTNSTNNLEIKINEEYNGSKDHSLKWHTDLTKTQIKEVEKRLRQVGNPEATRITDTANWYKGRINGDDLFVIYSTEDADNPTILYEVKGRNANLERNILMDLLEDEENGKSVNGKPSFTQRVSQGSWMQNVNNSQNNLGNLGIGQNNRNARVLQSQSQRNGSRAFWNVLENLFDLQESTEASIEEGLNGSKDHSLKDSEGNTLTEAQQEYFKDSKVRDKSGNLLVMYHGTPNANFTIFRSGTYFTEHKWYADRYQSQGASSLSYKKTADNPDTYAVYLNIKKPFDTRNEVERNIFYNEYYRQYGTGTELMESGLPDWMDGYDLQEFLEEKGYDYDGLILDEGAVGGYGEEVVSRGLAYVVFSSEQVKDINNTNPTSNPDINFSLKENVEETKNLIAVHNMQVSELERTLDLGGLPMPSIAIIKARSGHSEYGDVSLVFKKDTIDPKSNKDNKVYGGDAWTPTYPTIEYKPNEKIAKKISDKYYEFSRKFGYDESRPLYNYVNDLERQLNNNKGEAAMLEELYNDTRVMQFYLLDSGKGKVETINKETRTELTDEEVKMHEFFIKELGADVVDEVKWDGETNPQTYRKNYMSKYEGAIREAYKKFLSQEYQFTEEEVQNVLDNTKPFKYLSFVRGAQSYRENGRVTIKTEADYDATQNAIREAAGEDYRKWVDSLFKGIEEKSGIRNNVSYYTNNGNPRSWEALHWENNLENVIKVMKGESDVGSGTFFAAHSIWGVSAKNYGSIEEMKADTDRLKRLPKEEYDKIKESFGERLTEIAHSIMSKTERNPFIAADNAMECIVEAIRNSKTKSGILNKLKQYPQLTVTETTVNDIVSLVSDIANMPTEYFEAKPKRAVGLNEIATAVIPDKTSESTKARLKDMGIKYLEYETGNEEARLEALNSLEDVQFSLKEADDIDYKAHKELVEIIEHLKGEFEVTKLAKADPKKLEKMTRAILKEYSSKADFDETFKAVDELYQYMANGEDGHPAVWEDVYSRAYNVARDIVENALVTDDYMYQSYKHLRDYLRKTPMKFSEYDSVPLSYENFNDFRKQNIGRLKFTKDGTSISRVYQELSSLYPEFFDSEEQTNSADQLERMIDVLDELQPTTMNPFDRQIEQASMELANDLTSRFFDIPQAKPTFADKAERRVTEERIRGGKKVETVRQQRDAKIKKLIEKHKEKTQSQLDKLRQQRDAKVAKEQAKRRDALAKMSESQKAKVLRARIIRHTSDLSKKLVNPTDNQHIPYELQGAVATLLEHINLESNYTYDTESHSYRKNDEGLPTKRTQAFHELQKVYANIASSVVVDPDLLGENGLLSDVISLGDKRIADMTSSELFTVWQTIRAIEASVSTANKVFSEGKFATILEVAETLREDNVGKKEKTELKGMLGKGKKLTTLDMLTPKTYLHCLGNAGDSIFRMMRDAQDKHISIMEEVSEFTHKKLKGVNVNSLEKTIHTVKLGGEDVKLSTAQLMELYVLMKREQAVDHILVGGILPDVTEGRGLKRNTKAEPTRNLSKAEIGEALSILTDEQKKIADELQKFVSTVLSRYGNEASMRVYNYEKFTEENYWTIRTNKQEIQSEIGKDTAVTSIANKGMAKGTKPHANTSVRIGSIFDTFASHSADMATYAAWLGTSEDVNRIRNFVFWEDGARTGTVKGILDTVHGTQGSQYLEKLLTDIAIGVKGTDNLNPFDKLVGHYKAASVGANIRVIIQQPTAILRAMDMINPIYIAEGAVRPLKGWKLAKKYAPIAQWKDWGHFDINTGRQMKDVLFDNASLLEKTKQVGMWGASMADSLAWGQLWNAVEAETKAKHKELEVGSDAYYETVAKRFTEIVDHTQVVDGILQRSQLMRSADNLTKMATSFMGEPTKQYNMALSAAYDAKNLKGNARKKAVGKLGRTAMALAVAGIVNACAQSLIDAMRDDDKEKKYWEKWLTAFIGDGEDTKWYEGNLANTFNPLTYVPFVKDILSIMQGYDVKRMDTEAITKTVNAVTNMYKAVTGTGKYTIAEASAQLFAEIARMYGVPVANVKRDVKSVAMSVAIETDNYLMQYRMEKAMLNINYAGNNKNFIDILFNAYNNDREAYEIIYDDMLQSRYNASRIKSGMEERMKKAEGTKEATSLSKRYMTPETEKKYDSSLSRIKLSDVWKSANATQKIDAAAELYDFLTSTSETMEKTRAEAMEYGVDETEYTLWKLAIEMADQPKGQEGSGSYDYAEKAEAVNALNLDDKEIAYFIGKGLGETAKEEINEALDEGIDMEDYINFKAAVNDMKADKNANGKSIPNSKKRKVVNYLNNAQLTSDEWDYFYYEIMNYKR